MRQSLLAAATFALLLLASASPAPAQRQKNTGSITIYVKDELGKRLTIPPQITVTPISSGMPMPYAPLFTGDGGIVFSHLVPGEDYELIIKADGYRVTTENISLPLGSDAAVTDIVYLKPLNPDNSFSLPKGQYILAPRAEKEVQHGLDDLRDSKFDSARKHLEKAMQMAPGNPYVNYVMGMIYLLSKQAAEAKPFLEKSVSIDPKQPPALLALGTVRFQMADYPGAVQVLEQAVQLDATSWKAEWMLAGAYLRQKNYAKAREYAERALQVGKQNAEQVQILLGEALAGLGEREKAADTLQGYLTAHPTDPNAAKIRGYVETLRQPLAPAVVPVAEGSATMADHSAMEEEGVPASAPIIPASAPSVDLPPKENWAPPDVDAAKPYVVFGVACSLPNVLEAAGKNAIQLVTDLQQFSAIEEYQSVEIKQNEQLEKPETRMFNYLVFIEQIRPGLFHVGESRDARLGTTDVPGPLHDEGAPGRVLVFHPNFKNDFEWTCDGLGEWKDRPTWVVDFQQAPDRPTSTLAGYQTSSQLTLLPLKGRAWISQTGGQVVHLETDLTRPMPELGLMRQHFAIDYEPVSFQTHKVQLWLPESVDVYYQYRGHYMHNY
ncbi:MAG TPA: tetratricopeptide repeat protein, partial [Candidatus Acidoferrales bacterium]|nr:tetratricopeptide repeat protein [Candidatus Acidoferrales bacterium]